MKVFIDTNIFLEYFEQRREYQAVSQMLMLWRTDG